MNLKVGQTVYFLPGYSLVPERHTVIEPHVTTPDGWVRCVFYRDYYPSETEAKRAAARLAVREMEKALARVAHLQGVLAGSSEPAAPPA